MRQMTVKVSPGLAVDLGAVGDYVRIKKAAIAVRIESPDNGEFLDLDQGDSASLSRFERLRISHSDAAEQSIVLLIGNGTSADSSKVGGSVSIAGSAVGMSSAQVTVTNVSAQIAPANVSRRILCIQNNDAVGNVFVNLAGAAATVLNGIKIPPGGVLLLDNVVPSGAVTAIGSIASNANVVLAQG